MCSYCDLESRSSFASDYWATRLGFSAHLVPATGSKQSDALPFDGVGDFKPPLAVQVPGGLDDVPDTIVANNPAITVGAAPIVSTINTVGDQDYYQVTLTAGVTYDIGMYAKVGGPTGIPQADSYIEIYDAFGNYVVEADGGGPNTPQGLDALLTFTPSESGVYYVNARAFDQESLNGDTGDTVGDYELFVNLTPPEAYHPYYDPRSPLYALDWGSQVNKINQSVRNPDGNEGPRDTGNPPATPPLDAYNVPGKNVITIYFAKAGEIYVDSDPTTPGSTDNMIAKGMEDFEIAAFNAVFGQFEKVADVVFVVVDNVYNPLTFSAAADFTLITYLGTPGTGLLGRMSPPDEDSEGQAEFNALGPGWNEEQLVPGGFSFVTLAHELGHGMGLAHPHDNGGRSGIMRGVEEEGAAFDYTTGDFDLNQGVFTMMSYEDGWQTSPYGNASTTAGYGYLNGPMAFDIAVLQDKYGVNEETATGNDTYTLKDVNAIGTYYEAIWDAGGVDTMVYSGSRNATLDLRAATLKYEVGGGGNVSYAHGIFGGFTIANGVTIENATSGEGNDTLRGNAVDNILTANGGNDTIHLQDGGVDTASGGGGNDGFVMGAAMTSADVVDGGEGNDQLVLQGDYATTPLTLGAGVTNVESIALLRANNTLFGGQAAGLFSYNITTVTQNVAPGQLMIVDGAQLRVGENFTFNGAAETDGGGYKLYGGYGVETWTGGTSADLFYFNEGRFGSSDTVNGGTGSARDELTLMGDYNVTFGAGQITGIEVLAVLSGRDRMGTDFDYNLTMHDANLASGVQMIVDAAQLKEAEHLTFDGSAESNGTFRIFGGRSDDAITAGQGADIVNGRAGNDALRGWFGADTLSGGAGNDRFVYGLLAESLPDQRDTISDFTLGDLIDLSAFDTNASTLANDPFSYIGSSAYSANGGAEVRTVQQGNVWFVSADLDGNGSDDLVINVTVADGQPLTQDSFVL